MRSHSDVDIIADFAGEAVFDASTYAEKLCFARNLRPDVRPSCYVSAVFIARVASDGIVLA